MNLQAIIFAFLTGASAVAASHAAAPVPYFCPGAPDQCICDIAGYTPTAKYGEACSKADCASGYECYTLERCPTGDGGIPPENGC